MECFTKGLITALLILFCIKIAFGVKCYQCSTDEDPEGKDLCGAYQKFDTTANTPVDCFHDQSVTPGTFCVKITQQSPISYIWDARWRTIIRRCGSVAEHGVVNVCNWGVYPNGVYWEHCICTGDGCNGASSLKLYFALFVLLSLLLRKFN